MGRPMYKVFQFRRTVSNPRLSNVNVLLVTMPRASVVLLLQEFR